MPTVTITGPSVRDSTSLKDNRPWFAFAAEYQDGGDGGVVTPRKSKPIYPSKGVLTIELEAGIAAWIQNPDGNKYLVTVPNTDSSLWDVIAAGVAYPPDTRTDVLASAVDQYVETARAQFRTRAVPVNPEDPNSLIQWYDENGDTVGEPVGKWTITQIPWNGIPDKPDVIGAGATKAEAREAIDALAPDDVAAEISAAIADDGTVVDAAAAAVTADIAGRSLVQTTDPGIPTTKITDRDNDYMSAVADQAGNIVEAVEPTGRKYIAKARISDAIIAGATSQSVANTDYSKGSVDADGNVAEDALNLKGQVPLFVLTAWAARMTQYGLISSDNSLPYDLVIVAGQSNATERSSLTAVVTDPDPRMRQWNPNGGFITAPTIQGTATGQTSWIGNEFAREYLKNTPGRRLLIVPAALGSSGFTTTSLSTPPGGYSYVAGAGTWDRNLTSDPVNLYSQMISRATAARTAAGAGARIVAVLWSQGEADRGMTQAAYAAALDDLIAQTRTDLGITDLPFIIGSMTPELVDDNSPVGTAAVNSALLDTPRRVVRTSYVPGPQDLQEYNNSRLHWSPQGQTVRAKKMATEGLLRARLNTTTEKPLPPQNLRIQRSGTNALVKWEPPPARHTAFTLQTSTNEGTSWTTQTLPGPIVTEFSMTGLTATTPLWARISSTNDVGTSDYSRKAIA